MTRVKGRLLVGGLVVAALVLALLGVVLGATRRLSLA